MQSPISISLPLFLTLIRLVASPIILPFLFVYLLPLQCWWINIFLAVLFILFSVTDFFDGYIARKYQQESDLGKILDPIADKFLVFSALIALLAAGKIFFYWVVILIGREIFIMALRQLALEQNTTIAVSWAGKIKTTIQMIMITYVIVNPYQQNGIAFAPWWNGIELVLVLASIVLAVLSAYWYCQRYITNTFHMRKEIGE